MENSNEMVLHVHVEYSKPVEMSDFIASVSGINELYNCYVRKYADSDEVRQSKLYVEKVKEGSIEMFLCESVSSSLIPFAENMNIILEFAGYIKRIIDYYTKRIGEKPDLDMDELKALKETARCTTRDFYGSTIIGAAYKSKIEVKYENCNFDFPAGNGMVKQIEDEMESKKRHTPQEEVFKEVLMTVYQIRNDVSGKGNKAIIDSISPRKVGLFFASEELRNKILYSDDNPTKKGFLVDVLVMTAQQKLAAYKVTALHDVIELDEDEENV